MPARNPERERAIAAALTGFAVTDAAIQKRLAARKIDRAKAAALHADNLMESIALIFKSVQPTRKASAE